jgi:hypothetical protein
MRLFARTAVVGILALGAGALGLPGASAAGPATDACTLVPNSGIEHAVGLPHTSLTKHIPGRGSGYRQSSTCWQFLYRGHAGGLHSQSGRQAFKAGRAVIVDLDTFAFLRSA